MRRWTQPLLADARDFSAGFLAGSLVLLAVVVGDTLAGGSSVQAVWLVAGIVSLTAAVFMLLAAIKQHTEQRGWVADEPKTAVQVRLHTAGSEKHPCGHADEDPRPSGPMTAAPGHLS
jgi:hypothetical protein